MSMYPLARPTVYKSMRRRSRNEANWTAFFDLLGNRAEYETKDGDDGYVPDFDYWNPDGELLILESKFATTTAALAEHESHAYDRMNSWANPVLLVGSNWRVDISDTRCARCMTIGYTAAISYPARGLCGCWQWGILDHQFYLHPGHGRPIPNGMKRDPEEIAEIMDSLWAHACRNVNEYPQSETLDEGSDLFTRPLQRNQTDRSS